MLRVFFTLLIFTFINTAKSQVTIGSATRPEEYSLLELSTLNKPGGLRLPQILNDSVRNQLETLITSNNTDPNNAKGLVIYNMGTDNLEMWSGKKWVVFEANNTHVWINPATQKPALLSKASSLGRYYYFFSGQSNHWHSERRQQICRFGTDSSKQGFEVGKCYTTWG